MAAPQSIGFEGAVMIDLLKQVAVPPSKKSTTKEPNPSGLCMCGCGRKTPIAKQTYIESGWIKGKPVRFVRGHRLVFKKSEPVDARFWPRVEFPSGPDGCWVWTASKDTSGYGQLSVNGRMTLVHRISFEIFYKAIPAGMQVLHTCDNPPCVRPDHLFLGDDIANVNDKVAKGRQAKGERCGRRKLAETDIIEIRALRKVGVTLNTLSEMFGVSSGQVWIICARRSWKHVQ
jgi:hypothetical protein